MPIFYTSLTFVIKVSDVEHIGMFWSVVDVTKSFESFQ